MNIKVIFFAVMGLVTMQSGLAITPRGNAIQSL